MTYDEKLWILRNHLREGYIPNPEQFEKPMIKIFCKDCEEWITPEDCGNDELGCCMLSGVNTKADYYCEVEEDY